MRRLQLHKLGNHLRLRLLRRDGDRNELLLVGDVVPLVVPAGAHDDAAKPSRLRPWVGQRPSLVVCPPLRDLFRINLVQQLPNRLA